MSMSLFTPVKARQRGFAYIGISYRNPAAEASGRHCTGYSYTIDDKREADCAETVLQRLARALSSFVEEDGGSYGVYLRHCSLHHLTARRRNKVINRVI